MKKEALFIQCYKVNLDGSAEIKQKYNSGGILSFRFYVNGNLNESIRQEPWAE